MKHRILPNIKDKDREGRNIQALETDGNYEYYGKEFQRGEAKSRDREFKD
jgi:hypothetical protein